MNRCLCSLVVALLLAFSAVASQPSDDNDRLEQELKKYPLNEASETEVKLRLSKIMVASRTKA